MLTALIRTHPGREQLLHRAVASCEKQGISTIVHEGEKTKGYEYNLYCNELMKRVDAGWFFFLDSDDYVLPGTVKSITPHMTEKPLLVQMLRAGKAKPLTRVVRRGQVGGPCLIVHHSLKAAAVWTATVDGDYQWIKKVTTLHGHSFLALPFVNATNRNHGQ